VIFYISPQEEARAVQRAAARAGCVVKSLEIRPTNHGPRAVGYVECPNGWAAARMLIAEAYEDAATPGARDLALALRAGNISDEAFARAVHAYVKENVAFVREEGEVFQGPAYTLATGAGDCDDHARLVMAIARAGGLQTLGAFLYSEGGDPEHAVAMLCPGGVCSWAETTVDAAYGEHPLAAAERTGVLKDRTDLATKVRTMSEKDLAPIPADYVEQNPPTVTENDAKDLAALGFLVDPTAVGGDPTDPTFRAALLAFQLAHPPLTPDGLAGVATRSVLGALAGGAPVTGLTSNLSDTFLANLVAWVETLRAKGARVSGLDFLAVWQNESGIRSDIANSLGFAGLNQMGPTERAAAGFTGAITDYTALSPEAQLPYVQNYYASDVASFGKGDWSVLTDAGALYLINFMPAYIGHAGDPSFVLARRTPGDDGSAAWLAAHHGDIYANNRGLDVGGKGWIEVGDMGKVVRRTINAIPAKWAELAGRMGAAGDPAELPEPVSALTTIGVLVGATSIGAALAEWLIKS
jgi:Transglutaminase-like superfamily